MLSSAHVITYDISICHYLCPYKFAVGYVIKFDGIKSPYICPNFPIRPLPVFRLERVVVVKKEHKQTLEGGGEGEGANRL